MKEATSPGAAQTQERNRRATMDDVAAEAGVHKSTVSLALRNRRAVAPQTLERILRAVEVVGYRRDPLLDAFNFRRVHAHPARSLPSIAFITERQERPVASQAARLEAFRGGVEESAREEGWICDHFEIGPGGLPVRRLLSIMHSRRIGNAILAGLSPAQQEMEIDWSSFRFVGLETFHLEAAIDVVAPDHALAARRAVERAVGGGADRVGLCLSRAQVELLASQPVGGYRTACCRHGLPPLPVFIEEPDGPHGALHAWARQHQPEALVVFDELTATRLRGLLPHLAIHPIEAGESSRAYLQRVGATAFELIALAPPQGTPGTRIPTVTTLPPPSDP
jgi:DNA-binding LacI/PurR family transcriptional regulator